MVGIRRVYIFDHRGIKISDPKLIETGETSKFMNRNFIKYSVYLIEISLLLA